jgi:hypothetical protein
LDLDVNETQAIKLADDTSVAAKLLRGGRAIPCAMRCVRPVHLMLNGQPLVLTSTTISRPFAGVQIDCPITKGTSGTARRQTWV